MLSHPNTTSDEAMFDDLDRLTEIAALDVFSDEVRHMLDDFARRAAEHFHQDMGAVSIMLDGAIFFAGSHGLGGWMAAAEGAPAEWALCANAVRNRATYVIENATEDDDVRHNPMVSEDGVRSYAGAPLVTSNGFVLGACCVVGTSPRPFTMDEIEELETMAADVVAELEHHRR